MSYRKQQWFKVQWQMLSCKKGQSCEAVSVMMVSSGGQGKLRRVDLLNHNGGANKWFRGWRTLMIGLGKRDGWTRRGR